jgi:hypothetical protein
MIIFEVIISSNCIFLIWTLFRKSLKYSDLFKILIIGGSIEREPDTFLFGEVFVIFFNIYRYREINIFIEFTNYCIFIC